jgi:hypothetical protein
MKAAQTLINKPCDSYQPTAETVSKERTSERPSQGFPYKSLSTETTAVVFNKRYTKSTLGF